MWISSSFYFSSNYPQSFILHLPACLQQRLNVYLRFNWTEYFCRYYLVVIFSLFLGSLSHVLWDAFTHPSGWFFSHCLVLKQSIALPFLQPLPFYKLLQHGSSIGGLLGIAAFILLMPRSDLAVMRIDYRY